MIQPESFHTRILEVSFFVDPLLPEQRRDEA
jgi:hypothetical protein